MHDVFAGRIFCTTIRNESNSLIIPKQRPQRPTEPLGQHSAVETLHWNLTVNPERGALPLLTGATVCSGLPKIALEHSPFISFSLSRFGNGTSHRTSKEVFSSVLQLDSYSRSFKINQRREVKSATLNGLQ